MIADQEERRFVVQPAAEHHLQDMLDLWEAVAAEGRWIGSELPLDREARLTQLRAAVEGGSCAAFYVAVAGEAVVGQLSMDLRPTNVAELGMAVAAEWRRRGVGSALVEAGVAWATRAGAHKVALQLWPHNRAAHQLYRKFGFSDEGRLRRHYRRRNGELWDVLVMGLVLDEESPGSPFPG